MTLWSEAMDLMCLAMTLGVKVGSRKQRTAGYVQFPYTLWLAAGPHQRR